ncbi:hypothetical protein [Thalassotalea euphylliae]|uniref:DUF4878 domain-containing protein n=1 Tax=Thalassotalea euphylliae TaxID=1655234 RepID=A0A3E0UFE6_9GAMM|nr:hypothetical protein [Thalassotalea euphylliae]REL29364.1 hypothetical protein DXX94_00715 [Thalassotalea euphylliae]REL35394.1 hypothetical protein DXX92_08515 [Thalassotalea euphylliae]
MKRLVSIIAAFSFLLTGCTGEEEITELANPELVAVAFFDALYNQKDVKKAAMVCTPKLARILLHYKSPTAVSRHIFNMQFDKVEIKPDDTGVKVREQFKDNADIVLYFDGYFQNERVKDVKRISLKQVDGRWVIDKILKDPF